MQPLTTGNRWWIWAVILAVLSAVLRWHALCQTDFANGWDGYFYLVQLQSLDLEGRMHSPDSSLIYPWLRLFIWLAGDYTQGMKIGVAVLCGLWTFALARVERGGRTFPVLAAWSVFSPQLCYFAAQYPKNLLGMVLLVGFLNSLPKSGFRWQGSKNWWIPMTWLLLNGFGHRLTFVLAALILLLHLLLHWKNFQPKWLLIPLAGLALWTVLISFFPGLASWSDLGRLSHSLTSQPQFAPYSFWKNFGYPRIGIWWALEIAAVLSMTIYAAVSFFKQGKNGGSAWGMPFLFSVLLLFPFLKWSLTDLSWRMFLVWVLLTPVLFARAFHRRSMVMP